MQGGRAELADRLPPARPARRRRLCRRRDAALAGPGSSRPFTGRAIGGVVTTVTYRGRQVGERRRYDNRLAKYTLRLRLPERFGERHTPGMSDLAEALATLEAELEAGTPPRGGETIPPMT